jgi:peptidyl-prolyl cis-trans isomerase SurA
MSLMITRRFAQRMLALSFIGTSVVVVVFASSASAQMPDPSRFPSAASPTTTRPRLPNNQRTPSKTDPAPTPAADTTPVAPAAPIPDTQKTLDQIAAVVNGEVITRLEMRDRVDTAMKVMARQGMSAPPTSVIEHQVLERMIVEKVQIQLAVENGVRVDDLQLDRAVQRVAEQNNMTVQVFRDRLEREGTTFAGFRDDLRQQIMIERARGREVDDKVQVSEGEVDAFIAAQNGVSPDASPEVDVAQILVRVPESASAEQIEKQRAKADDVFQQIKAGGDFGRLAATFSDAPEALQGGDLGFRAQDRLPQLFIDAIAPLEVGQVAAPVKSANGFHILKLVAKRRPGAGPQVAGAPGPVEQTHARHILIKVNEVVTAEQAKTRLEDIRQRIVNKTADFEDMARAYSTDASASKGGDLGTLYPGDTVPEFEKAMNALKPGEISEPVQSPFGYHLIQVVERKTQDVAQDRLRLLARQAIRERKIDEAADSWTRELRDKAYVEMRIDDK